MGVQQRETTAVLVVVQIRIILIRCKNHALNIGFVLLLNLRVIDGKNPGQFFRFVFELAVVFLFREVESVF